MNSKVSADASPARSGDAGAVRPGDADPARPGDAGAARGRRRQITAVKDSLRELSNQLSVLNHQVSSQLDLKDTDLECLDLIARHGPLSPSVLARRAGLHPATMTGVLDRLERGGWVSRERDPDGGDRRAVAVRARRERGAEVFRLYAGMNSLMDQICDGYTEAELRLLNDFLRRVTGAGQDAAGELGGD
jgi:DNA-binding MarR family transcriptional regulator